MDATAILDYFAPLSKYGGSVWFAAAFLRLNIAVAHGVGASTRVHVGGGVSFF